MLWFVAQCHLCSPTGVGQEMVERNKWCHLPTDGMDDLRIYFMEGADSRAVHVELLEIVLPFVTYCS